MLGTENILLFVSTGILLNLYPGPDTLYIIGRSVSQGRLAGISATLGISSGAILHLLFGSLGLSAIITTSAKAFMIVKIAGAGYLIYQGLMMLFKQSGLKANGIKQIEKTDCIKIYKQGVITHLLNPKVAVFFMAFLPQFIAPDSSNKGLSFVFLGFLFLMTGTIWCSLVALFSSAISNKLRSNTRITNWLMKINGLLFMYLGLTLATATIKN